MTMKHNKGGTNSKLIYLRNKESSSASPGEGWASVRKMFHITTSKQLILESTIKPDHCQIEGCHERSDSKEPNDGVYQNLPSELSEL